MTATSKFFEQDLRGYAVRVPATFWSIAWAKEEHGDKYLTVDYNCVVDRVETKKKSGAKVVWIQYKKEKNANEVKAKQFLKWVKEGRVKGTQGHFIVHNI